MTNKRKLSGAIVAVAALAVYVLTPTAVMAAHGGGHGGGGAHHAGGGGHHGGGEHRQPHPYHPSQHHAEHHAQHHGENHEQFAHHNHHHENWHRGDWGPGYWGGAGLGYAGWGGWGYDGGGDTYVDNSTTVNPVSNESGDDDSSSSDDSSDDSADNSPETVNNQYAAASPNSTSNFPVDDWPELGVVTYAGEYGASQGQVVVRVVPNSAAAKAGFVPGDVILSLNGQPTPSADDFDTILDTANGRFEAQVWDARTGRTSTISGQLDPNGPASGPQPRETAATAPQSR